MSGLCRNCRVCTDRMSKMYDTFSKTRRSLKASPRTTVPIEYKVVRPL